MQGSSDPDRELLDAAALVGHLVPPDTVHGFLPENRLRLFPDELFADLFGSGASGASDFRVSLGREATSRVCW